MEELTPRQRYCRTQYQKRKNKPEYRLSQQKAAKRRYWQHVFKRLIKATKKQTKTVFSVKPFDLWKIAKRQKLICPLTGRKLTNTNTSVDHITPLSKGGHNSIENLRLVDTHANLARLNYSDDQFFILCHDVVTFQKGKT